MTWQIEMTETSCQPAFKGGCMIDEAVMNASFRKRLDGAWRVGIGVSLCLVLTVLVTGLGCNRSSDGPIGQISGTVTYEGRPVSEGMVCFSSGANGVFINVPLQEDGTYVVIRAKGQGLPVGNYLVTVIPPPPDGPMVPGKVPQKYPNIPQKYRNPKTSGLSFAVEEKDNRFDIQMSQ